MKRYCLALFFAIFLCSPLLRAQPEAGAVMLGSSANLLGGFSGPSGNGVTMSFGRAKYVEQTPGSTNIERSSYAIYNISFSSGFFLNDRLLTGTTMGMMHYRDDEQYSITQTYFSPMVRRYFKRPHANPYVESRLGMFWVNEEGDKYRVLMGGLKGGIAYFVNKHVSIDPYLDLLGVFEDGEIFPILGLGVGFSYFLRP